MTTATAAPLKSVTSHTLPTELVPVTIVTTSGIEIEGDIHVKPDSYQSRVSDLLNHGGTDFVPVTSARIRMHDGRKILTHTMIVAKDQIELLNVRKVDRGPLSTRLGR